MGDPKGFLSVKRKEQEYRPVCMRLKDQRHVTVLRGDLDSQRQASRCMDCGTPFCHWGCPVGNYIPEWNDMMFKGHWKKAYELLQGNNPLPEVTGRICPGTCEYACVLGINDDAVTIRDNELSIIEHAFSSGFIKPWIPFRRTGKKIAVVGSGPAGLACAVELNNAGHFVTVFERDPRIGGILRYGIPDFKLEKWILDRRIDLWRQEGILFRTGTAAGKDITGEKLLKDFDAVVLACGSRVPRDLPIEGRELNGIHGAMDFLVQANKRNAGEKIEGEPITAEGKKVVVIGGGDTGADCVGTVLRQGASCVVQIEIMPQPPQKRPDKDPWPRYPMLLKITSSHQEGGERQWSVMTRKFIGKNGTITGICCAKVTFPGMKEIPGSDVNIEADLVLLALGFLHPEHEGIVSQLGLKLDQRGNIKTGPNHGAFKKKVFAAGDMRRGQSLVVWALYEGRETARFVHEYLMHERQL